MIRYLLVNVKAPNFYTLTDIRYIQSLLGHRSPKSTEIYLHLSNKTVLGIVSPFDKEEGGAFG